MKSIMKSYPNEMVYFDIVGPFPKARSGNEYILTLIDSFTRWPVACPIENKTSNVIAQKIFQEWICNFGLPEAIFSDRAKEFKAVVSSLAQKLGIRQYATTGYQPQANGQVERFHRFLNATLSIVARERARL